MLINLLEQAAASENFGERAASGGFTFLLGMIVVFAGMALLVFFVAAFGKAADGIANKVEKGAEKEKQAPEENVLQTAVPQASDEVSEDIKVAIVAAIAAYYETSGSKNEFTVRKIKKL